MIKRYKPRLPSEWGCCKYCHRDLPILDGGQFISVWGIALCARCIRMGSTEGFTPWIGDAIAADLAAKGLPPMPRNEEGFFMLPDRF